MPIFKEMLRLDAEGKLIGAQKSWMAFSRSPGEHTHFPVAPLGRYASQRKPIG